MSLGDLDAATWVAIAAVVVAVASAWAAGASARSSRRSAEASERSALASEKVAEIEAARHHVEREPNWLVSVELMQKRNRAAGYRLSIELTTAETIDRVNVTSVRPDLVWFLDSQEGVDVTGEAARTVRPIRHGQCALWRVGIPSPAPGGAARFEVTSSVGDNLWTRSYEVKLPSPPPRIVVV